jgi:hypothetical protein
MGRPRQLQSFKNPLRSIEAKIDLGWRQRF